MTQTSVPDIFLREVPWSHIEYSSECVTDFIEAEHKQCLYVKSTQQGEHKIYCQYTKARNISVRYWFDERIVA